MTTTNLQAALLDAHVDLLNDTELCTFPVARIADDLDIAPGLDDAGLHLEHASAKYRRFRRRQQSIAAARGSQKRR